MSTPDPRAEVCDMIADSLRTFKLTSGLDKGCYLNVQDVLAVADAVMSLLDLVECQHTADGHCYVLRTAPTEDER